MFFPFALALVLLPLQNEKPAAGQEGLALLKEVGRRYADAKSYHIEAVEERNSSNELQRSWQKTLLKAVVMPGGRYRFEGRSGYGAGMFVSDGTTQWVYHVHAHAYTQKPAEGEGPRHRIITGEELPVVSAQGLVRILAHRADHLKSAAFLSEQTITVGAREIPCYVVHYTEQDLKTKHDDLKEDLTLWVSKQDKIVVKTLSREETFLLPDHVPISEETTVLYEVVKLDQPDQAETFKFVAPSDAKLVDKFPEPFRHGSEVAAANLMSKPAPELSLKAADGKAVTLSSLRGKPVFLEFWATWCGPCVELTSDLKKLYAETEGKGLAWVSIDNDEDSKTAAEFVSKENIPWPNYHDEDGSLGRTYQREGIPLGVLIDAEGKITFYKSGYEIAELRSAIAKLGPQFSVLATSMK
jgi:thiol-disulfide isomerase/thioredoxin